MRILWLVSWYPDIVDPLNGDFIQRMARAASAHDEIYVIYIAEAMIKESIQRVINKQDRLIEEIFYIKKKPGKFYKIKKQLLFYKTYKNAINNYILQYGFPHCVHVQVPWKAGLLALWMQRKYGIPYVVTEHWGIYSLESHENYVAKPFYFKKLVKRIFQRANKLIVVSHILGKSINQIVLSKSFTVIPNVVDSNIFKPCSEKHCRFTFLHVSNMVTLKNVGYIIKAFDQFIREEKNNAQLVFIGNRDNTYVDMASQLGLLNKFIFFKGELSYKDVAIEMQKAHCLILISSYETFSCVVAEALCCGLPIIATKVGVVPEIIRHDNGVIIEQKNNIHEIKSAMKTILQRYSTYNADLISMNATERFNFHKVSSQLHKLYYEIAKATET